MPRLLSLGLIAVFALAAAACGAEAVPSESTKAVGSARVETVTRTSWGDGSGTHEFRSTQLVDYANDRRTYVDESSGCQAITIGDVYYSELPPGEGLPEGKRWVKSGGEPVEIDSERLFEQSQVQRTSADGSFTSSTMVFGVGTPEPAPDEYLDYLRESSGEPERVGEEDVRGVPTTRYRTTLDVQRVIRKELEAAGWKAANIERYLEDQLQASEKIDVWVDAEGRARRIVTTTESAGAEQGMLGPTVTTSEYLDFGVETAIEPPPVAEVMGSDEWQRITEEQLRERLDEDRAEIEEGIAPMPGAFDPSPLPDADSAPTSCLH